MFHFNKKQSLLIATDVHYFLHRDFQLGQKPVRKMHKKTRGGLTAGLRE